MVWPQLQTPVQNSLDAERTLEEDLETGWYIQTLYAQEPSLSSSLDRFLHGARPGFGTLERQYPGLDLQLEYRKVESDKPKYKATGFMGAYNPGL